MLSWFKICSTQLPTVHLLDTSQPKSYLQLSRFWTPLDRPDKIHTWVLHYTVCCTVQLCNFKLLILLIFYTTTTSFNPLVASSNLARPTNIKQKPHSQGGAFCLCIHRIVKIKVQAAIKNTSLLIHFSEMQ